MERQKRETVHQKIFARKILIVTVVLTNTELCPQCSRIMQKLPFWIQDASTLNSDYLRMHLTMDRRCSQTFSLSILKMEKLGAAKSKGS